MALFGAGLAATQGEHRYAALRLGWGLASACITRGLFAVAKPLSSRLAARQCLCLATALHVHYDLIQGVTVCGLA
jgi:hypothetical protein